MPQELASLDQIARLPFDELIDARSPAEYAEDHIPGAISLPVLSDDERARVGTIYVQEDRFLARKTGAALVARNVARHLEGPLSAKTGGWRPLVYCWRGGQRSGSFSAILGQIGWRTDTISGGYRSYRRLVVGALYEAPIVHRLILIDGGTGTAKTRLLDHIARAGGQVLDLEALAAHRGSLFGGLDGGQPSQKAFESALAMALVGMDPARPVFTEAESSKIGKITLTPSLWRVMRVAEFIEIKAPLSARAQHLVTTYDDLLENPDKLAKTISRLVPYHGHAQVDDWLEMAQSGAFHELAGQLMTRHYDPRYTRLARKDRALMASFDLPDLNDETLARTALQSLDIAEAQGA